MFTKKIPRIPGELMVSVGQTGTGAADDRYRVPEYSLIQC